MGVDENVLHWCCAVKAKKWKQKPQSRDQHTTAHWAQVCPMLLITLQQVCSPADRKQDSREQTKQRTCQVHDVSFKNPSGDTNIFRTGLFSHTGNWTKGTWIKTRNPDHKTIETRDHLTSIWNYQRLWVLFWSFRWDFLSYLQSQPPGICLILLAPCGLVVRIPSWIINMAFSSVLLIN